MLLYNVSEEQIVRGREPANGEELLFHPTEIRTPLGIRMGGGERSEDKGTSTMGEDLIDGGVERTTLLAWLGKEYADVADALMAQEFDTRETLQALTLDLLNQVLENERVPPRKLGSLTKILRRLHDHSGTQPETSKGALSAHGCTSVLRSLRNALGSNCSFEDVESLVGNLILLDTFLFGFAVTLMTSTFSHDDLLAADTRYWILEPGCYASHIFMWCAMVSGQILVGSLLIGLFLVISLGFSDCRAHKCSFRRWLVLGRPLTCVAYLMFIVGFGFFFIASSLAVDLILPRYPISPTVGVQFKAHCASTRAATLSSPSKIRPIHWTESTSGSGGIHFPMLLSVLGLEAAAAPMVSRGCSRSAPFSTVRRCSFYCRP